ncbi:MAG: hypothetical protein JWO04_3111 [Gammaproteobacteria bacterium]|nr:hypothetical protein [Gammaproteobacteria bacterium]
MKTGRFIDSVWRTRALWASLFVLTSGIGSAVANTADENAIRGVLTGYQDALNACTAAAAVALYAEDGVLMPPYNQSVLGRAQLSNVYGAGFKVFTLHVKFTIREIVQMSREWAFARTNSSGTHKDNATGVMTPEENQELFVLRKGADGVWKIARYSFSSIRSPPP